MLTTLYVMELASRKETIGHLRVHRLVAAFAVSTKRQQTAIATVKVAAVEAVGEKLVAGMVVLVVGTASENRNV